MANSNTAPDLDEVDAPTLNPKWFHPVVAGLWLGALGVVAPATGLSPWWWAPAGFVLTLIARAAVAMWVAPGTHGHNHYDHARTFALTAGFTATAWLIYAGVTDRAGRAVGTLALWTIVFGSMYAVLRHRAPKAAEEIRAVQVERAEEVAAVELNLTVRRLWGPWFAQCGVAVEIEHAVETPAGYTLHLTPGVDGKGRVAEYSTFQASLRRLAVLAARHYRTKGITIGTTQLRPEETDAADEWLLHVDTKRPLQKVIPYPGDMGAGSILEPATFGIYADGLPITEVLNGVHGMMVGFTGSGKSVCLNCLIAAVTRCPDAELWVAARSKLISVVFPWLLPWLTGKTTRPVIDRVGGEELPELLRMLADAYELVKRRNRRNTRRSKHRPTIDDPAVVIVIDEAHDLGQDKDATVTTFDGREWTASGLLDYLTRKGRSASVAVRIFTQTALVEELGDHGPEIIRNIPSRIAGRTMRPYDGTATLVGMDHVDTTKLRDHTLLFQPSIDAARVIPGKAFLLDDEDQITDVAITHTRYRSNGLPDGLLTGDSAASYRDRWQPFRQPTLVEACEDEGIAYPIPAPRDGDNPTGTAPAAPAAEPPARSLPAPDTAATLDGVTTTATSIANLTAARDQLMAKLVEAQETAGLGRVFVAILQAFRADNAPAYADLPTIAFAAELARPDGTDEELSVAVSEAARHLMHFGVMPVEHTDPDAAAAPVSDFPVFRRADVIAAYERIKAAALARENGTGPAGAGDELVDALAGRPDTDWIGVGQLGRMVGFITEDEDPRAGASRFSEHLRTRYQLDDTAFRRRNTGSQVSVAAIRKGAARRSTVAA